MHVRTIETELILRIFKKIPLTSTLSVHDNIFQAEHIVFFLPKNKRGVGEEPFTRFATDM